MYQLLVFIFLWTFIFNVLAWMTWIAYYFFDFRTPVIP